MIDPRRLVAVVIAVAGVVAPISGARGQMQPPPPVPMAPGYPPPPPMPPPQPAAPASEEDEEEDEDEFLFRPFVGLSSLTLALKAPEDTDLSLEYQPNVALSLGVRGGYGPYMASGSIGTAPSNDSETYGRSRYLDLQFAHSLRADGHEVVTAVFLQQYRGFFLEGARRFDPAEMDVVTFPKMKATAVGVAVTFFLDPAFSYEDAFMEYRPRRHSEGSWALRLSLGHMSVDSGGAALVPQTQRQKFGDATGLQSIEANFASASIGYAYDWMIGRGWFLGAQVLAGLSIATTTLVVADERRRQPSFNGAAVVHLASGYAGERFHAGLYAGSDLEGLDVVEASLQVLRNFAIVFGGVRF